MWFIKVDLLKEKVESWINMCEQIMDQIKLRLRETDSKFQKKILTESDISGFRQFLQEKILDFE